MEIYLDNSATTKPHKKVISAMATAMEKDYFNPSSSYFAALNVEKQLENIRRLILQKTNSSQGQVIFTSGGTEANNIAVIGALKSLRPGGKVLISDIEHPSVEKASIEGIKKGFELEKVEVDKRGRLNLESFKNKLDKNVVLICVMHVNNEIGTIQPISEISRLRDKYAPKAALHVDGVQGFMKVPVFLDKWSVQSYSISGHKVNGPKGIGALIKAKNYKIKPLIFGGRQQHKLRAGTENSQGIMGLGQAIKLYELEDMSAMKSKKELLWRLIANKISLAQRVGPKIEDEFNSPHILNISLPPVRGETMVNALQNKKVYVSTGAACSSGRGALSQTIKALNLPHDIAQSSIRLSLSPYTTEIELEKAAEIIAKTYKELEIYKKR